MIVGTIGVNSRGAIVLQVANKPELSHPLRGNGANAAKYRGDIGPLKDSAIGRKIVAGNDGRWSLLEMVAPGRDILRRTDALGLRAITYTNRHTPAYQDAEDRSYWIPRDCVARDGRSGIFHRISEDGRRDVPGAIYDFDGWEPWGDIAGAGTMFGGRCRTYESALAWLESHVAAKE